MGKKSSEEFSCTIKEFIGSVKDSSKHDWCKALMRITWGENPTSLDIRNVNMGIDPPRVGKGISLSNEEADKLVALLLDEGYGSLEDLERAIKKKRSFFSITEDIEKMYTADDDGPLRIDIDI